MDTLESGSTVMPIAVITGAGKRVGRAIALELGAAGFDLVVHAHSSTDELSTLINELKGMGRTAWPITSGLAHAEEQDRFADAVIARAPIIEALIHNAGIYERQPFAETTRANLERMMQINLEAPFFISQRLLPALQLGRDPCIIHLTDSATERPYAAHAPYFISKAALENLTRSLAAELAPLIRVNAVAPGTVLFPPGLDAATRESITAAIPLQRIGNEKDVALAVRYLVVDAPFVTGQTIAVDGGRSFAP